MLPSVALGAVVVAVGAALLAVFALQTTSTAIRVAAPALLVGVAVWMFFCERYDRTLAVVLLYLGLLDGFVKLKTGSTVATLGRDVLLYSIALGALVRAMLRKQALPSPPLLLLVVAWVLVCVAQIFNPAAISVAHAAAAIRQHIEFVPLFFAGFLVLRSKDRLTGLFVLLVIVAAVNGVVALVQEHLTPAQLASWGPGYANEVFGSTGLAGRVFYTASGASFVRPPALGGDAGFGGVVGLIALPGTLALLVGASRLRRFAWLPWLAGPLVVLAVATSQARSAVVGSVVAIVVFLALTVTSRRGATVLVVTLALAALSYAGASRLFNGTTPNRYSSIAPSKVVDTTVASREGTLALIPTYALQMPLGVGMGSAGPAANAAGGAAAARAVKYDAESEFTFLEIELGLPGLVVFSLLAVAVVVYGVRLRRIADPALQRLLMALTAVSIAFACLWIVGVVSASSPDAPFFWLSAGALAYWHREARAGRLEMRSRRLRAALGTR